MADLGISSAEGLVDRLAVRRRKRVNTWFPSNLANGVTIYQYREK